MFLLPDLKSVLFGEGVDFGGENSPVRMVFVLAGSRDERTFHLRALMAIAEITNSPDFDSKWLKCRDTEELRDLVLLTKRRRGGKWITGVSSSVPPPYLPD